MLKVTESQGFTLSLEDAFFEKPQGASIAPLPPPTLPSPPPPFPPLPPGVVVLSVIRKIKKDYKNSS